MPCLIILVALFLPRVTLFFLWLMTSYLSRAYTGALIPLLGFFFMPYTTLAYAIAVNDMGGLQGLGLVIFVLGVLADAGAHGGGYRYRQRD